MKPKVRRASFSLYPSDVDVLEKSVSALRERSLRVDHAKFIRGLLQMAPEFDLLSAALAQYKEDQKKTGHKEKESVALRLSINETKEEGLSKLSRVVASLEKHGCPMGDSYVLRSLLRHLPDLETLTDWFTRYLEEFPDLRWNPGPRGPYKKRKK
jgi:hypothetical protein